MQKTHIRMLILMVIGIVSQKFHYKTPILITNITVADDRMR